MTSELHDLECERQVLYRAQIEPDWLLESGLTADDFYYPAHQRLLRASLSLAADGVPVDTYALQTWLREAGEPVPGPVLESVESALPTAGDMHTKRLQTLAYRRVVRDQALRLAALVSDADLGEVTAAISALSASSDRPGTKRTAWTARDMMRSLAEVWVADSGRAIWPGCDTLHCAVGNLLVGSETVIGADTNVGKSSLILRMAMGMDASNMPVGIISLEDDERVFASRMVAARSGVSSRRLLQGRVDNVDGISPALEYWAARPLMFAHLPGGTDADVTLAMTRMVRQGARCIFVDYLQAITGAAKAQDRRNETRVINTNVKAAAQRLGVPLVMASQLRRPMANEHKRPSKHDLKEAGDVENAADLVLLMWREEERDDAPLKVWVAKSKTGGVGTDVAYKRDRAGVLQDPSEGNPFG